jgi:hypothetical protein
VDPLVVYFSDESIKLTPLNILNILQLASDEMDHDPDTIKAVIKVRYSPYMKDLIEFTVELNGIPVIKDGLGKDVTVNWEFLQVNQLGDLFTNEDDKGNRVFYTDSNGLEMQTRVQDQRPNY